MRARWHIAVGILAGLLMSSQTPAAAVSGSRRQSDQAGAPAPGPILHNGGFEEGESGTPAGWLREAWQPTASLTWVSDAAHGGAMSLRIALTTPNDARWSQVVTLLPGANYRLSGWIKTDGVAKTAELVDAGANLCVMDTPARTAPLLGTNDWTSVSVVFNSGPTGRVRIAARLGFYSGTTIGTAWFDDVRLDLLGTSVQPASSAAGKTGAAAPGTLITEGWAAGAYRPGNGIEFPVPKRQVRPQYTADAMRAKIQGVVGLECVVLPSGKVGEVRVVRSLDPVFGLDQAAIAATKLWQFTPAERQGKRVPVLVLVELTFTLR